MNTPRSKQFKTKRAGAHHSPDRAGKPAAPAPSSSMSTASKLAFLNDQQRALLVLLSGAGLDGISAEGMTIHIRSAGFDDLTLDDVRGPQGFQKLAANGLAEFRLGKWFITRKGKEALA